MARAGRLARQLSLEQALPFILIAAAIVGLTASFALTYDKIHVLQNPAYQPACNINPILSCGSVMKTEQASLLGMPNTVFGLVAFSALLTFGVVAASGARLARWLWLVALVLAAGGVIFMHYLFFQGVFRIHAICPWCAAVWAVTIPTFWYIALYNLQVFRQSVPMRLRSAAGFLLRHHGDMLGLWYVVLLAILLQRFWYYWSTLV